MIEMILVQSSNVEAIGYDPELSELHVRFLKLGSLYIYHGVPEGVFEDFLNAPSKGTFLNTYIKGNYDFRKE